MPPRPYRTIAAALSPDGPRDTRMRAVVDALWDGLHPLGVSWVGFYVDEGPAAPDDRRLVLGPCRDTPACSPIGLHGACGRALLDRETLVVRDVAELGDGYIACHPRDRSEIVVPLLDEASGACWGVLDLDSFELAAFGDADAAGLAAVLRAAGFTTASDARRAAPPRR